MIKILGKIFQRQKTGDNSTPIQIAHMSVHQGLTPQEAFEFATNLFKNNFPILEKIAAETARKRAEELTIEFIKQAHSENPKSLDFLIDPDGQFILRKALVGYARNGSKDHFELIINLLKQRANSDNDIKKILTNESIETIAKLTSNHFDMLSILYLIKESRLGVSPDSRKYVMYKHEEQGKDIKKINIKKATEEIPASYQDVIDKSLSDFNRFFKELVFPIILNARLTELDIYHLCYSGCGVLSSAETWPLHEIVSNINNIFYEHIASNVWFETKFRGTTIKYSPSTDKKRKEEFFREALTMIDERYNRFFEIWEGHHLSFTIKSNTDLRELNQIELTSVGKLIALANINNRFTAELIDYFELNYNNPFDK